MAAGKSKSLLAQAYGAKAAEAVTKHGSDETTYGIINLPPNINNGVAQLVEAKFDKYKTGDNKGQVYFRAAGVVVSPETVETKEGTMRVAGLQTSIMMPCCPTKNSKGEVSMDDNIAKMLNELRKLGVDTASVSVDDLDEVCVMLKEAGPYFRFTTSPRKDQQTGEVTGAWENWHGVKGLEDFVPPEAGDLEDNTTQAAEPEPEPVAEKPKPATPKKPQTGKPGPGKPAKKELTLKEKAALADANDMLAAAELTALANEAGISDDDMAQYENWDAIAEEIERRRAEPTETEAAETTDEGGWEPAKDEVYGYQPPGPGGKPGKQIEVEVTAVDSKAKTVALKSLDDPKKTFKNVAWDKLVAHF